MVQKHPTSDYVGVVDVRACLGIPGRYQQVETIGWIVQQSDLVYELDQLLLIEQCIPGQGESSLNWSRVVQLRVLPPRKANEVFCYDCLDGVKGVGDKNIRSDDAGDA